MSSRKYDVIIIGAGIGGLTCGCYLAKAGMKVLIVEQHTQVGGYCTSFNRQGFTFNVLTSTLGNLGKNKALGLIMSELGIDKKLDFIKVDPSDIILTSVYSIPIYSDFNKTINKLQESFPKEAIKIKEFFDFIRNSDMINLYFKLRRKTLKELLDSYFLDIQLKSIFTMMLCRLGLHPKDIAAFTSVVHFREFIMDMGYHPKGGMQRLSDAFAGRFRDFGGEILLKSRVDKIIIKNKKAMGVNIKGYWSDRIRIRSMRL
ncbi:MAG: FAD-dependent oxidoreductase [Candidatus Omnitrophica bacterium]|nr:FAD-dependent oxidoreductase [Candidatus Omnitrophota bacterium]